jgi:hypothetical protein
LLEKYHELELEAVEITYWCDEMMCSLGVGGEEQGESDSAICGCQGWGWKTMIATYTTTTAMEGCYITKPLNIASLDPYNAQLRCGARK